MPFPENSAEELQEIIDHLKNLKKDLNRIDE
jgi:hypothetical protein